MSICVVVTANWELSNLTRWGALFACSLEKNLSVIYVQPPAKGAEASLETFSFDTLLEDHESLLHPALEAYQDFQERRGSFKRSLDADTTIDFTLCRSDQAAQSVLEFLNEKDASLLLLAKHEPVKGEKEHVLPRVLFEQAVCETILIRPGSLDPLDCKQVVVPVSGGPHALAALRTLYPIVRDNEGRLTPIYITPPGDEIAAEAGERLLSKMIKKADLDQEDNVFPQLKIEQKVELGIQAAVEEGANLLVLGASNAGSVRRLLFGTVPQRMLTRKHEGLAIAVIRAAKPLRARIRDKIERWLDLTVPQLEREDRISLFERLQGGSDWNFDFLALMSLSTAIATLGLIQNSAAVVIGAMLVAPLMTPLLGAGLALVQGNVPLLREAGKSIILGFLCALLIGFGLGWIVPTSELTSELSARGGPTLLDMVVALLSGLAAAHCSARPNLSSALPGVAIAAALVPPVATTGVALAIGEYGVARGAGLLFATNVVAIIIGSSFSLYAAGVRTENTEDKSLRFTRRVMSVFLVALVALAIPLTSFLASQIAQKRIPPAYKLPDKVVAHIEKILSGKKQASIQRIQVYEQKQGESVRIILSVRSPRSVKQKILRSIKQAIESGLGRPVVLQVRTELEWKSP